MYKLEDIMKMRELYFDRRLSLAEVAEKMDCDYRTVKRYVTQEDFNVTAKRKAAPPREKKLDPFIDDIEQMFEEDRRCRCRKQRHTAKRIYEILKEKGYTGCYSSVVNYVRARKKEMGKDEGNFIPLEHPPGTAQCDFGTAEYYEQGRSVVGRYVVLTFPHSNASFLQLCPGENLECLTESLLAIFEYIGGVPSEIWFDNGSAMVAKVLKNGERILTDGFMRFQLHYKFNAKFMNPASGNEKGAVENAVGTLRRNLLVPVPSFTDFNAQNRKLLEQCSARLEEDHYRINATKAELFKEDQAKLIEMNPTPFDTARYVKCRTNKYGKMVLDGLYTYSVSPAVSSSFVNVKISAREVIISDPAMHEIVRHRRLYGEKAESMNWFPYLKYIARKPRSLFNTPVFKMMPPDVQSFMKDCTNTERGRALKMIADLTERSSFDDAVGTIQAGIQHGAMDPDSLMALYRRMYADVPPMPDLNTKGTSIPSMPRFSNNTDLNALDAAVRGGFTNGKN